MNMIDKHISESCFVDNDRTTDKFFLHPVSPLILSDQSELPKSVMIATCCQTIVYGGGCGASREGGLNFDLTNLSTCVHPQMEIRIIVKNISGIFFSPVAIKM